MLENFYKKLGLFLKKLTNTCLSILKVIIQSRKINLPPAARKTCYILGNGPSLNESLKLYSGLLRESELYVVNGFAISEYFLQLKPQNYVFLDQYFTHYDGKYTPIPTVQQTYECLIATTSWPLNLFVPALTRNNPYWKEVQTANSNIKIHHYNYVIFRGFEPITHWFFSRNLAMPQCQNILGACIFLAINRKHEKVVLLGADHSWHEQLIVDENNTVSTLDKHFYNPGGTEVNLKKRVKKRDSYGVHIYFASLSKAFYSYWVLQRYAVTRGVTILNASSRTYIDAFERVKPGDETSI